ncbi:hypothetical protein [Jeotgalibacillus terrae]|uniref:Uncharacterized protein n=1 Tax=Jeotgalibacillus terrae TaxID=587735 RepID=A0ABW5ZKR7_9BACL|nr:hypothetical protein [Jeotgalibacillus terrae]MBM7578129.1 hypothetical protein [Jeotgalibacillus terrae]
MRKVLLIAFFVFIFLATVGIVAFFNEDEDVATMEQQLENLTVDFTGIIDEVDTEYGKLTFFSLENEDGSGVGLALFAEDGDNWIREESTYHSLSDDTYSSGSIDLPDGNKVVYGYGNTEPIEEVSEITSDSTSLEVADGAVHYMIVPQEHEVKIEMPEDEQV